MAVHFFVNFNVFKSLYLAYYWIYLHQTWGFCKAWYALYDYVNSIIYRLVPSPSRFEIRQLSRVPNQRFSTSGTRFSRVSRHFWHPSEGVKMSKFNRRSIDLLIIFRCLNSALAGKNPVYRRFVSLQFQGKVFGRIQPLETSIWRTVRDRDNNNR